jgi:hypothetical protein
MANSEVANLQAQQSQVESDIASRESERARIVAELARVTEAKSALGKLKEEARGYRTNYNNNICPDIDANWAGNRKNRYWFDHYLETEARVDQYIRELDGIHDALITREHELTVERNNIDGQLAGLRNAWSWITSNLSKLFN